MVFKKSYSGKTEATGFNFSLKVWGRPPNGLHYCQAARAEAIRISASTEMVKCSFLPQILLG